MLQSNPVPHIGAGLPCSAVRQLLDNALPPERHLYQLGTCVFSAQPIPWHVTLGLLPKAVTGGSAEGCQLLTKRISTDAHEKYK